MIRRTVSVILAVTLVLSILTYAADYIQVGSFNVANFGASETGEYERSLVSLVNIILETDADATQTAFLKHIRIGTNGSSRTERESSLVTLVVASS